MALKNFAYSTVLTAPSTPTAGTSLVVAAGEGALFPTVPFAAVVWPANAQPMASNAEVVTVTAVTTDTFTITRAQESSSAKSIAAGYQIMAAVTAALLDGKAEKKTWTTISGTTPALVFSAIEQGIILPITGNTTFTSSGYVQGAVIDLYLTADTSLRTLTFPAWTWYDGTPANVPANKGIHISLTCLGTTAASVAAEYTVVL